MATIGADCLTIVTVRTGGGGGGGASRAAVWLLVVMIDLLERELDDEDDEDEDDEECPRPDSSRDERDSEWKCSSFEWPSFAGTGSTNLAVTMGAEK